MVRALSFAWLTLRAIIIMGVALLVLNMQVCQKMTGKLLGVGCILPVYGNNARRGFERANLGNWHSGDPFLWPFLGNNCVQVIFLTLGGEALCRSVETMPGVGLNEPISAIGILVTLFSDLFGYNNWALVIFLTFLGKRILPLWGNNTWRGFEQANWLSILAFLWTFLVTFFNNNCDDHLV